MAQCTELAVPCEHHRGGHPSSPHLGAWVGVSRAALGTGGLVVVVVAVRGTAPAGSEEVRLLSVQAQLGLGSPSDLG